VGEAAGDVLDVGVEPERLAEDEDDRQVGALGGAGDVDRHGEVPDGDRGPPGVEPSRGGADHCLAGERSRCRGEPLFGAVGGGHGSFSAGSGGRQNLPLSFFQSARGGIGSRTFQCSTIRSS